MAAVEEVNIMEEFDVVAVLPAGGCGVRMNMELPKQVFKPWETDKFMLPSIIEWMCVVTRYQQHSDTQASIVKPNKFLYKI